MTGACAAASAWQRARLAAVVFALDPLGIGVAIRSGPGPARDAWLQCLANALAPQAPMRRIPASIADDRLIGGLDIAATMRAGRPIAEMGVLAQTNGGVLVLAMAERIPPGTSARLAAALDTEMVAIERDGFALRLPARFGFVALDEGRDDDETLPAGLLERCGYVVDLGASARATSSPAPARRCRRCARASASHRGRSVGRRGVGLRRRPVGGPVAARPSFCSSRRTGDRGARRARHADRG